MKVYSVAAILLSSIGLMSMAGCSQKPYIEVSNKISDEASANSQVIEVSSDALSDYWVKSANGVSFIMKDLRLPKVAGVVRVKYLIDEQGRVSNVSIVSSEPKGAWDDFALEAVNNYRFEKAPNNPTSAPVFTYSDLNFGSDLPQ